MSVYEIRVQGRLDPHWAAWFAGLTLTYDGDDMVLSGPLADEAALHGALTKVRDLHVRLLWVRIVEEGGSVSGTSADVGRASGTPDASTACAAVDKPAQRTNDRERRAGDMSSPLLRGAGSYFFEGSPVGCLLVHGMGSAPYQVRSLGEYLAWQGLTVLGVRLPGHGTTLDELEQTTSDQWLAAIDNSIDHLQQTCAHIILIGNSLGGVLALAVAARRGRDLAGLVTISTPVSSTVLIRLLEDPAVPERFVRPDLAEVLCSDPRVGTFQYPQQSKKVLAAAYEVFKQNQATLSQINIPLLVIQSRKDRSVPMENAHFLIEHVSSADKDLVLLNDSAHLPTLDFDKERVQVACLSFIERIIDKQEPT
jgi:carboxylesterase